MEIEPPIINQTLSYKFGLAEGICEYLAGCEEGKMWEELGTRGKNTTLEEKVQDERQNILSRKMNNESFEENVQDFVGEVNSLFHEILSNELHLPDNYLEGKEFYFILGMGRTGGTYLYKEISRAVGWPWSSTYKHITHDRIPRPHFLVDDHERPHLRSNGGWKKPDQFYAALFDICQFLVYARDRVSKTGDIVWKNFMFSQATGLLDLIFGDRANYFVTVRHPAGVAASRIERFRSLSDVEFSSRKVKLERVDLWTTMYSSIADNFPYGGKLEALQFGKPLEKFMKEFFRKKNFTETPEEFSPTSRRYDEEFWNQPEILKRLRRVEKLWNLKGIDFPFPEGIL